MISGNAPNSTLVMASSQLWKTANDVHAVWPLRGPTTLIARSPQSPISHPPKLPHWVLCDGDIGMHTPVSFQQIDKCMVRRRTAYVGLHARHDFVHEKKPRM